MAEPTYSLCLSFTRNGLTSRVPWFFVLYQSGAIKGLCLRAKADSERGSTNADGSYPKYDFLAREDAYVDNYPCHGRVVLATSLTQPQRNSFQQVISSQDLSEVIDGQRDCQKWVTECLPALGFDAEFVGFWRVCRGKNIWEIEEPVNGKEGLTFLRGPAYVGMAKIL